jgi:restriction system protein
MLAPDPRFERIDAMGGREFEAQVAELLDLLGYEGRGTDAVFDNGADTLATKDGLRVAVHVKRWSKSVGVDAVRQLIDGTKRYGCDRGLPRDEQLSHRRGHPKRQGVGDRGLGPQ